MRWLLRKDLLILGRSRLLVALLILYPVVIALLIGFAISRSPSKPKVALVNLSRPGQMIELGEGRLSVSDYTSGLFSKVDAVRFPTRRAAVQAVESGRVVAAVVIPQDITEKLSSAITQAQVEVIYNGNALEQTFVRSTIDAALAQANLGLSENIKRTAAQDIGLLLRGGDFSVLGTEHHILGLSHIASMLHRVVRNQPPGHDREVLQRMSVFADFAAQNLGLSKDVLSTVSQPVKVSTALVHGRRTPLDTYAVVVAVTTSLMFIAILLAAGSLALEREENTLARLTRGPPALISQWGVLTEKTLLSGVCAFLAASLMLMGIGAFVHLSWGRVELWLVALASAALICGAFGTCIGAIAREVRAASLLAFGLALPLIFLALVPAGAVAGGLYDVIRAISLAFPFKAALQALDAAVNQASPSLGISIAHLLGLGVLYLLIARVALSRTR